MSITMSIAAACVGGAASIAAAQDETLRVPTRDELERAAVLFERSALAYEERRYDVAVALLSEAYTLSREPILVYNLARAHEGGGELESALDAYRRYLELAPDAENAGLARERIAALQRELEARARETELERQREVERERAAREEAERAARAQRAVDEAERRAREEARRRAAEPSPWPWVVAGGGAAGIVVGTALGVVANERHGDAVRAETQIDASARAADAQTFAMGANVALMAGGVLLGVGLTWGVIDLTDDPVAEGPVGVEVSAGPGGVTLRGTF